MTRPVELKPPLRKEAKPNRLGQEACQFLGRLGIIKQMLSKEGKKVTFDDLAD